MHAHYILSVSSGGGDILGGGGGTRDNHLVPRLVAPSTTSSAETKISTKKLFYGSSVWLPVYSLNFNWV